MELTCQRNFKNYFSEGMKSYERKNRNFRLRRAVYEGD